MPAFEQSDYQYMQVNTELPEPKEVHSRNGEELTIFGNVFRWKKPVEGAASLFTLCSSMSTFVDGDYVFVYRSKNSLILGSGLSGLKNLYFTEVGGCFYISDKWQSLVRFHKRPRLDPLAAFHYLKYEFVPDPLTLVTDIFKVPNGSYFQFSPGGAALQHIVPRLSQCESKEFDPVSFRKEIYNAHAKRLTSDETCIYLSGGIDSCVSASVLKDLRGAKNVTAYTFSTLGAEQDESHYAQDTADFLGIGMRHIVADPTEEFDYGKVLKECNSFYFASCLVSQLTEAALPGKNFFACQDTRLHTPALNIVDRLLFSAPVWVRRALSITAGPIANLAPKSSLAHKGLSRLQDGDDLVSYLHRYFFHEHELDIREPVSGPKENNVNIVSELSQRLGPDLTSRQIYNLIVELSWRRQYTDDINYMTDTTVMGGSTCQMPWYDAELAFASGQIPMGIASKFVRGKSAHGSQARRVNKYVLRKCFADVLPNSVLFRHKAVCITNHIYLKNNFRPYVEKLRHGAALFDTKAGHELGLSALCQRYLSEYKNYGTENYLEVVELQNMAALNMYCEAHNLA